MKDSLVNKATELTAMFVSIIVTLRIVGAAWFETLAGGKKHNTDEQGNIQ